MEKKLVCNQYVRHYDESMIARHDFSSARVVFRGTTYTDVTKAVMESEGYCVQFMTPEEMRKHEILTLLD